MIEDAIRLCADQLRICSMYIGLCTRKMEEIYDKSR